jgi:hypothetical protein
MKQCTGMSSGKKWREDIGLERSMPKIWGGKVVSQITDDWGKDISEKLNCLTRLDVKKLIFDVLYE